jgi:4-hydroxy-tetrahydrodipicolinate synthase
MVCEQAKGRVPVSRAAVPTRPEEAIDLSRHASRPVPTPCWSSRPITTSPPRRASTSTSRRSTTPIGIPIIIYNIPARSVIDMSVDTMKRLFELKNIAGVKDATANMVRVSAAARGDGPGLQPALGRGRDLRSASMRHGGHGCISVTSNVAPRLCAEFQGACLRVTIATALNCTTS